MDREWKDSVWGQFGAALEMFENAIRACPERLWGDQPGWLAFSYLTYHTLFWLDYYFAESREGFAPPEPFTLEELDPAGILPDRSYTKEELLGYLAYGREKCRVVIRDLTEAQAAVPRAVGPKLPFRESLLYSMRHVQHHTAQLNMLLRQGGIEPPRWVTRPAIPLD